MEDFIFSASQLEILVDHARYFGETINRKFINGKEFTQRGDSPLKSNHFDVVLIARNVTDNNPNFLITYQEVDPEEIKLPR